MGLLLASLLPMTSCDGPKDESLEPESPVSAVERPPVAAPPARPEEPAGELRADGTRMPEDPTKDALRKLRDPERWRGRGSLRGLLTMPGGLPAPAWWRLELVPSRTLAGREHAVERTLELPGSETEFVFEDLPFGGYDLRVYTEGYASLAQAVSIERGTADPYVQVALSPLGTVRGLLVDKDGRLIANRAVHLRLRRNGTLLTTESRADGTWFFENVEPGAWTLIVGSVDAPAIPPIDFDNSGARSSNLGEQVLPVTGGLRIHVADGAQVPIPGARVVGYTAEGGNFEGVTDDEGWFEVDSLAFGTWKLLVVDPEENRARNEHEVESAETETFYVTINR